MMTICSPTPMSRFAFDAEQGIDQVKMLDDDALAAPDSQPDGVRQLRELMEAVSKRMSRW